VVSAPASTAAIHHAHIQRPTVFRILSKPVKQRDRHLRWPASEEDD
jgi:hypothetical protein